MTARQAQRVIAEIYANATGEHLPSSTVRAFFESWLARKQPETASSSFTSCRGQARAFLSFLGDRANMEIGRVGAPDILSYRKAESERVSATSVNIAIKFLRMVFEQAKRDGLLVDNPAAGVSSIKKTGTTVDRRPFTLDEVARLLAAADSEWRSLVLFGFYTSARLSDLARLTWANVDLLREELRFVTGKTGRRQIIPLAGALRRHLETMTSGDDPKEPLHSRAFEIVRTQAKSSTLSRQFGELMAQVGLAAAKSHRKAAAGSGRSRRRQTSEVSFHALRHTATSLMKNAGISAAVVMEFVGHESEAVNRTYTHINVESMRRAADTLPDLLGKEEKRDT